MGVEVLLVGALMLGFVVRRTAPLACVLVGAVAVVLLAMLGDLDRLNMPMVFLFVTPYTIARHAPTRGAVAGLLVCLVAVGIIGTLGSPDATSWLFNLGALGASWATGRFLRAQRLLADELSAKAQRISGRA